jgi:hypothetical protein
MWLRILRCLSMWVVVVAGSEVAEPGFGVGEQVEDDDQDGAGHGHQGFALAAAAGQAAVALGVKDQVRLGIAMHSPMGPAGAGGMCS